MRLLLETAIFLGLCFLPTLSNKVIALIRQRHIPPAMDADEEADALPFGPTPPSDTDN